MISGGHFDLGDTWAPSTALLHCLVFTNSIVVTWKFKSVQENNYWKWVKWSKVFNLICTCRRLAHLSNSSQIKPCWCICWHICVTAQYCSETVIACNRYLEFCSLVSCNAWLHAPYKCLINDMQHPSNHSSFMLTVPKMRLRIILELCRVYVPNDAPCV